MESNIFSKNYLSFNIAEKTYVVPILSIVGVFGASRIIPITDKNNLVVGIFNMNNFNIPIFDLRLIMNKPNIMYPNRTCVLVACIVVMGQEKLVGFVVDSLYRIYNLPLLEIENLPVYNENEYISAALNKDGKLIMILSLEKIINKLKIMSLLKEFQIFENSLI